MRFFSKLVWLLIIALALQTGCGGNNPQQVPEPEQLSGSPGLAGLVSPTEALKGLSFVGEERLLTGSQYSIGLLSSNVSSLDSACVFEPAYTPPTKINLADAAYAIYAFSVPGYTGDPEVEIMWETPPTDLTKLYYGIGNFSTDRWDWVAAPVDGLVNLSSLVDHQSPTGAILITAVLMGEDQATLAWLKVGGNVGPDAGISADPILGDIPFSVDFDASASIDHDGTIVSYEWDLDGDGSYELGPAPEATESRTYLVSGSYDVVVQVTDDLGETDTAIVTINANVPGNIAPFASVSAEPTTGTAPLLVDFDGSVSDDPDGTIDLYEWDWDNDGVFDESSPTDPLASHTFADEGIFEVVLRVMDNQGITDTASVSITVEPGGTENETPVALLTANPLNRTAPFETNFNATGSSDSDGTIVKYEYDWESSGSFVELPANTQHTYQFAGNHDCTLRVTDNDGAIDTYTLRLTGNDGSYSEYEDNDDVASANAVPNIDFSGFTGNAGGPLGYNGGKNDWYQLHLEANLRYRIFMSGFLDADADLDMRLYEENGTTIIKSGTSVTDDEEIIWLCDQSGIYYLKCYSHDDNLSDYTLEITSTVLIPPVADIQANPVSGDWPLTVDFDASGSTDNGTIVQYEWDFDGNGTFEVNGDTEPTYTHEYTTAGVFDATVRVTDDTDATDTASVEITVINDAPVASFTADPTSGNRRLTVEFDASASYDPDAGGGIAKYEWDFDGDGIIDLTKTDTSDDPPLATALYYGLGTFDATLTVTDVAGSEDSTSVEVTVTGAADNETEPNNDQDADNTSQDAFLANSFPGFPFSGWFGTVGPKPVTDGPFGDPDDWYKFTVNSSGEVDIYMDFIDSVCDIDMKLYAEGDYTTTVGSSAGVNDDEQITVDLTPGTYYLRVYAFTSAPASGTYQIQATFTP